MDFSPPVSLSVFQMRVLDTNLGPFVLGILFNTYLYGIVTYQYFSYCGCKFQDPLWLKVFVLILFCIDTFHTTSLIYLSWYYLVANYGNVLSLVVPVWPYPLSVFVNTITALLAQLFLSYRTWRLTNVYVFACLVPLCLASFVGGILCGVKAWVYVKNATAMPLVNTYLSTWLSLEVVADIVITGSLIYALNKSRSGLQELDTVVNRLIRTAIQTGLFSGIFAILTLVFYLARQDTELWAFFGLPISRLYTNTLMDSLLCREGLRGIMKPSEAFATGTKIDIRAAVEVREHVDPRTSRTVSPLPQFRTSSRSYADREELP